MRKLKVDENKCIGCGTCTAIDNEHFELNDDGLSSAISNKNLDSENLKEAIDSCPTDAISIDNQEDK